jgi:hypothetical protein
MGCGVFAAIVPGREFGARLTRPARRSSGRIRGARRRSMRGISHRRPRADRHAESSAAHPVPWPTASRKLSTGRPIPHSTSHPSGCQTVGRLRSPGRSLLGRRGHLSRSPPVAFRSPRVAAGRRRRVRAGTSRGLPIKVSQMGSGRPVSFHGIELLTSSPNRFSGGRSRTCRLSLAGSPRLWPNRPTTAAIGGRSNCRRDNIADQHTTRVGRLTP